MSLFSNSNGRIGRTNADQYNDRNLESLPYPKNSPSGPPLSLGTKQTLEGVHVHGDIG